MKKVAVIELETTQIKLTIATILDNETFVINEQVQEGIKIASDLCLDGLIKPSRTKELLVILKSFKTLIKANDVTEIYSYATSEFNDTKNQKSFFEELYSEEGFKFNILSNDEKLINIYTSVLNSIDAPKGLIVNIGGNKTQILHYNRRSLINQHTFNFGMCSLAEEYVNNQVSPEQYCKQMYDYVIKQAKKLDWLKELESEVQIIGVGAAFLSMGKLSRKLKKYPYNKEHNYSMNREDVCQVYDFIKTLDLDKTKKLKGISADRADYLSSGMSIIKAIHDICNLQNLVISATNITEGVLFNKACPLTIEKPLTDILAYSLTNINSYYNTYSKNTNNVYELSLILFKQLKVLHKLSRTYVRVLRVASMLHDCGKRINSIDYTTNGFSVVLNSNIYGITHREQVLASFVVACQYLENFNMTDWVRFKDLLVEEDLEAVRKLAIIVRLANALDKFNRHIITDISCDILGDSVIMKTITESNADLEIREGMKLENDFAKAFKKHLEIL